MIFYSPIQWLARFAIKTAVRHLGLNTILVSAITMLYHASIHAIRDVGIIPTLRVLWALRRLINKDNIRILTATSLANRLLTNNNLNGHAVQLIAAAAGPVWRFFVKDCLYTLRVYNIFLMGWVLSLFKPILYKVLRFSFGVVIASLGVLYNETLSGLQSFKSLAIYIIENLEDLTNFKLPRPSDIGVSNTNFILTGLGIIIGGAALALSGLLIFDYFKHDTVTNTPILNGTLDPIYNIWNTVSDYAKTIKQALSIHSFVKSIYNDTLGSIFRPQHTPIIIITPPTPTVVQDDDDDFDLNVPGMA